MEQKLKDKYAIPVDYLEYDPSMLLQLVREGESKAKIVKLFKTLNGRNIHTIRELIELEEVEILDLRSAGPKTIKLLYELLQRATVEFLEPTKIEEKGTTKVDHVDRLVQRYIKRLTKDH